MSAEPSTDHASQRRDRKNERNIGTHLRSWVAMHGKPLSARRGTVEADRSRGDVEQERQGCERERLGRFGPTSGIELKEERSAVLADSVRCMCAHDEPILLRYREQP